MTARGTCSKTVIAGCVLLWAALWGLSAAQTPQDRDLASQVNQAQNLLAQGRAADAESLVRELLAGNTRSGGLFELLGRIYDAEHRYAEAEKAYRKSIDLEPRVAGHHVSLGVSLLTNGQSKQAVE